MKQKTAGWWQKHLDNLFSIAVRARGKCERCGKTSNLQTSHIYSRSAKETRWYLENANCLCGGCHLWWHANPYDATKWLEGYYGKERCEKLRERRRITKQWSVSDYVVVELILKDEIKKYETP